ncbi:MAG TPA: carboxypeptidase-like regulatory domain-containing protein [Thermoplasmata archaeon]|nr:carboxypeptidase-like regulatory domain-containing protein [Thermoplasmata archaeon]
MRVQLAAAAFVALSVLVSLGGVLGEHPSAAATGIVTIEQSPRVTEQGNLTVSVEVGAGASVHFAYFTFCQLVAPYVCFNPIALAHHNATWFVGMTKSMSSYQGCPGPCMPPGAQAGFNVTVEYTNGTNVTEPTSLNSYPGLTVVKSVAGYFEYQMTVAPTTYSLSGVVSDSHSGTALAGARVTLTPSNQTVATNSTGSTGTYQFTGLPNGTYSLSASANGHETANVTVEIAGASVVKNLPLLNRTGSPGHPVAPSYGAFFSTPIGLASLAAVGAIVVIAAVVAYSRSKKPRAPMNGSPPSPPEGPSSSRPPGPK